MNKIYLRTAFRNFKKNKIVSTINVFGLAIGIAASLIIYQYIVFELSFDKFNNNSEQLYRIERDPFCSIAPSFVPLLKKDFPEIETIARLIPPESFSVRKGDMTFMESNICFAEADILKILTFKFIEGTPENSLDKNQVIITKSIADKYFGSENPIGKMLVMSGDLYFTISAVVEDYPENSHLDCDFLCSYSSLRNSNVELENDYYLGNNNFSDNVVLAYAKFNKNTDVKQFESKLPAFIDLHIPSSQNKNGVDVPASSNISFTIRKVEDIHLYSHKLNEVRAGSDISYIYLFLILAIIIIMIACINFFNLSTATIDKRFNETGVKRIFGIKRFSIYFQFFVESFLLVVSSTAIAIALYLLILPLLKSFLGIKFIHSVSFYLTIVGLTLILSIVTGFVPGNYLSRLKLIKMLKISTSSKSGQSRYRTILVVFQFVAAIGLFVTTAVIYKQMELIKNRNLGFDKENILLIPAHNEIINNWSDIYQQLLINPYIKDASLSKRAIGERLLDAPGLEINIDGNWQSWSTKIPHIRTDYNFFKTYDIKIIEGRDFDKNILTDNTKAFILNETAVKKLGIKNYRDIIGKQVRAGNRTGQIIGIVSDFNYESLHNPIIPMVTYISINSGNMLSIKIRQSSINETIRHIENILDNYLTNYQFTYSFFDDRLASQYENEERMMLLTGYSSLLAIFIAGLGLLGLSLFFTERKIKEIGIRKVNGAKISEILTMLNKDFVKWVIIAFVIATPVAWFAMNKWLENFAYKTTLSWWIFALAGLLALGIALLTVSWQSWRAATRNPVEALRYE